MKKKREGEIEEERWREKEMREICIYLNFSYLWQAWKNSSILYGFCFQEKSILRSLQVIQLQNQPLQCLKAVYQEDRLTCYRLTAVCHVSFEELRVLSLWVDSQLCCYTSKEISSMQTLANIIYRKTDGKIFNLCGLYGLCHSQSTLHHIEETTTYILGVF